jgi:hypothetical protein
MVVYSVEHMADERASLGHDDVARKYQYVRDALAQSLSVESSGDLPTRDKLPEPTDRIEAAAGSERREYV